MAIMLIDAALGAARHLGTVTAVQVVHEELLDSHVQGSLQGPQCAVGLHLGRGQVGDAEGTLPQHPFDGVGIGGTTQRGANRQFDVRCHHKSWVITISYT